MRAKGGFINKEGCKNDEFEDVGKCVLTRLIQCQDKNIAISRAILQENVIQYAFRLHDK